MQSSCRLVLGLYRLELRNSSEAPQAGEAQLLGSCSCALPLFWCTALLDSCSKGQFLERDMIRDVVNDTALASPYRIVIKTGSRNTAYLHSSVSWDIPLSLQYLWAPA